MTANETTFTIVKRILFDWTADGAGNATVATTERYTGRVLGFNVLGGGGASYDGTYTAGDSGWLTADQAGNGFIAFDGWNIVATSSGGALLRAGVIYRLLPSFTQSGTATITANWTRNAYALAGPGDTRISSAVYQSAVSATVDNTLGDAPAPSPIIHTVADGSTVDRLQVSLAFNSQSTGDFTLDSVVAVGLGSAYSATVTDSDGVDCLGGMGAGVVSGDGKAWAQGLGAVSNSALTLNISGALAGSSGQLALLVR